jgi:hypothetical protein
MLCSLITFIIIVVAIVIILDNLLIINLFNTKSEKFNVLSSNYPLNSFDITNKMNSYRTSTDPYDNNFYSNTNGFINSMDKYMYGNANNSQV